MDFQAPYLILRSSQFLAFNGKRYYFEKVLFGHDISVLESKNSSEKTKFMFLYDSNLFSCFQKAINSSNTEYTLNPLDKNMLIPIGSKNISILLNMLKESFPDEYERLSKEADSKNVRYSNGLFPIFVYPNGFSVEKIDWEKKKTNHDVNFRKEKISNKSKLDNEKSSDKSSEKASDKLKCSIYENLCKFKDCERPNCWYNHIGHNLCFFDSKDGKRCDGSCYKNGKFNHYQGFFDVMKLRKANDTKKEKPSRSKEDFENKCPVVYDRTGKEEIRKRPEFVFGDIL